MTEETRTISAGNYCEVCGVDVEPNTNLKRFGKLFCSAEHMTKYVEARERKMGVYESDMTANMNYQDQREEQPGRRSSFGGGGCCG